MMADLSEDIVQQSIVRVVIHGGVILEIEEQGKMCLEPRGDRLPGKKTKSVFLKAAT
jgi:hypothetical protein